MSASFNATAEVAAAASYPKIRVMTVGHKGADTPQNDLPPYELAWSVANAHSVGGGGDFGYHSAISWFVLLKLFKHSVRVVCKPNSPKYWAFIMHHSTIPLALTVDRFSGRDIFNSAPNGGVPLGLIVSCQSSTTLATWSSKVRVVSNHKQRSAFVGALTIVIY